MEARAIARPDDVVIILAAVAAELEGHEQPARPGECLAFKGELPCGCRFKGGKHGAALADELVQLERKRTSAVVAEQFAASG